MVALCSQQLWLQQSPALPQNIWLPHSSAVPHVSPLPSPCGLRGAGGAELLLSRFWCRTSAPLTLWKSLQDPVVPHRPQHILGAVRESRWSVAENLFKPSWWQQKNLGWAMQAGLYLSLWQEGMVPGCTAQTSVVPLLSVGNVRVLPSSGQNGQGELLGRSRKGRRMRKAEQFTTPAPHHTPTYIPQWDSVHKYPD